MRSESNDEHDDPSPDFYPPPLFLIQEGLKKLRDIEELNEELLERYKVAKKVIQDSPEFKEFKKTRNVKR